MPASAEPGHVAYVGFVAGEGRKGRPREERKYMHRSETLSVFEFSNHLLTLYHSFASYQDGDEVFLCPVTL